jgi:hypothetical protein
MYRLAALLTVAFVALKLAGYISWPWIWVLMPIPVSFAIMFTFWFAALLITEKFLNK